MRDGSKAVKSAHTASAAISLFPHSGTRYGGLTMSKSRDTKKDTKKPATKSIKEKRAEKKAKKAGTKSA